MRQILVLTGDGKGKTTSAIGTALRSIGHNKRVLIIQFMKESETGEIEMLKKLENCRVHQVGNGFYKIRGDHATKQEHTVSAQKGLTLLRQELEEYSPDLVILDEINVTCSLRLLDPNEIITTIREHPETNFILTGRDAPRQFLDIADLITEMTEIRHPFQKGKPAQKGIDF